jgi:TolB protein
MVAGWKKIVFAAFFYATDYNPDYSLYLMNANGENLFRLTTGFSAITSPNWSSDGKQIVFDGALKENNNLADIFVINSDGTNLINLTNSARADGNPVWSSDGKSILFSSDRTYQPGNVGGVSQPDSYEIYVMDADGKNVKQLTFNNQDDLFPKWSPDGQWIAFQENANIYLMDKDGNHVRQLTRVNNGAYTPFWMPDGKEIGFSIHQKAIQFINIETGQTRSLLTPGNPSFVAPWSPPN